MFLVNWQETRNRTITDMSNKDAFNLNSENMRELLTELLVKLEFMF